MANLKEEEVRTSKETAIEALQAGAMGILTVDTDGQPRPLHEQEDVNWHELTNAFRTRKILSGMLGGIEKLESGWVVAVIQYKGYRVIIPMEEMMINLEGDGRENADTVNRQTRLANNMLGAEIDFIVRDMDQKTRSIVASRKEAMLRKRQLFYFTEGTDGHPMVRPGRIVEARVIAVAPKAVRLEVFGVECSLKARDMAWEWMVDANDKFANGDIVLVKVLKMTAESPKNMRVEVSAKEAQPDTNRENLMRLRRQGKYVGKITDVYKGTYFIHLNNGVNAVAHSCNTASLPGRKDEVGFVVTRINDETQVAEGIITRVIKRCM
ncbi:S1 RNA-binding domain-containing protein [[Clostridium] symbiosum]|uniref:S1 RNA-binding domain-containing protein n=1 Tax=Clostridium symbiosum TaxID=1512 RepID=UPI003F637913